MSGTYTAKRGLEIEYVIYFRGDLIYSDIYLRRVLYAYIIPFFVFIFHGHLYFHKYPLFEYHILEMFDIYFQIVRLVFDTNVYVPL